VNPEQLFTQAGRMINFHCCEKKVSCNYYFTRLNNNSPNKKLWMNILIQVGDRKDVYEINIEQPEDAITLRPKTALDQKVKKLVETYLLHLA
jgi:hypothetical protein